MVDLMSLLRDVLVCSLQVWMLNDFGKNMFPYRVEPLWKRIGVYFAAALCIFIANHMGTTLFNIAIIPASYTIAAIIIFQGSKWKKVIIGGSSLTMFQLLGKISEVFSLEIEPEEFIEMASVRNIASYIAQILNKKENEKLKDKGKIIPPSVVQEAYYIGRNQEYDLGGISTHAYYEIVTEYTINANHV